MSPETIVFDLDGTLVDTASDLVGTLNAIFVREGLSPVPYETARNFVGGGAKAMISRGMRTLNVDVPPDRIEKLFVDFIDHYSKHIADHSRPFPGVVETLDNLAARGCRLAVCTNKLQRLSLRLLDELDLTNRFVAICGQDTFGVQKPDPEILRRTVAAAGGTVGRTIMVGDSATDIRTARAAGVPVVAVDFGYSENPVTEFDPDRVISHFAELPAAIRAVSSAP